MMRFGRSAFGNWPSGPRSIISRRGSRSLLRINHLTGFGAGSGGSASYRVEYGLRVRAANSARFTRTFGTPTNNLKWKWRATIKRGTLGTYQVLFTGDDGSGTNLAALQFNAGTNKLQFAQLAGGSYNVNCTTDGIWLDPNGHYDIELDYDSANATAADRVVIKVNGVRQALTYTTGPFAQNTASQINVNGRNHAIGYQPYSGSGYFDGIMSNVAFVDGSISDTFNEISTTSGQLAQKSPTVATYGANGSFNEFKDASNNTAATIGKDTAPIDGTHTAANNWTPTNISVTAGVTNDQSLDTPSTNIATLNPLIPGAANISWANLRSGTTAVRATHDAIALNSYWEVTAGGSSVTAGVISESGTTNTTTVTASKVFAFRLTTAGALDYRNVTDAGSWTSITTGLTGKQFPYGTGAAADWNFGQMSFIGAVPSPHKALSGANENVPTIPNSRTGFYAEVRTGTGAVASVTTALFQPGLAVIKGYPSGSGTNWNVFDNLRGTGAGWNFNDDPNPSDYSDANTLTAFNSNGISLGSDASSRGVNISGNGYVDYLWQLGAAYGVIAVQYTGNGSTQAIAHTLGVAPEAIITKAKTNARRPTVLAPGLGAAQYGYINMNSAFTTSNAVNRWGNNSVTVAPTSTHFTVGNSADVNENGVVYIAYLFVSIPGFSRIFSYTGNSSSDGPFLPLDFKPRMFLIKDLAQVGGWRQWDSARQPFNGDRKTINPNSAGVQQNENFVAFTARGVKIITGSGAGTNDNVLHLAMAFADVPAKYATAA